ncbi:hypothetical protein, partial [Mycobacterium sp. 1245111.1]|uniref:hypothetical protein n=1 Tax=Mycobacterium sp. 1245111.1 TaxID=1834073 RepID=UPI000ABD8485
VIRRPFRPRHTGADQAVYTLIATVPGNVALKALVQDKGEDYTLKNLRFALLDPMVLSTDNKRVLAREVHWKQVLQSRLFGNNRN